MKTRNESAYPHEPTAFEMNGFSKLEAVAKEIYGAWIASPREGTSDKDWPIVWAFDRAEAFCAESDRRKGGKT